MGSALSESDKQRAKREYAAFRTEGGYQLRMLRAQFDDTAPGSYQQGH
jgi:hypothetical protein